ncbi:lysozyme inhibitor LprI family protein [Acetonema longum]|uniref:Lysozyme inhibitor LprI-like N-terminal domain-containing protein n=1 Tax=Acetonema longum DSM 6540 TaxID=1009370 RepID=F7NJH6_9FIRM|nr:lysozyme inhibitor LprI family protein [Acetonema longum]EGO63806.1 hypothetical protein ALO_11159 [Acetonema longum DSM 6540]
MVKNQLAVILLVLGLTVLIFNKDVWAAKTPPIKEYNENFEIDYSDPGLRGSQSEMNEAAYREFKRADDKLNEIYGQIFVKYKNNKLFLDKLTNAEIAWIKYRDAYLESIYSEKDKHIHYGSVFPIYNIEAAKLTWDRVKQLNQWLIDYPEGMVGLGSRGKIDANTAKSSEITEKTLAIEAYKKVLQNKAAFSSAFYQSPEKKEKSCYLHEFLEAGANSGYKLTHFTMLDMDGNKIPEVVL